MENIRKSRPAWRISAFLFSGCGIALFFYAGYSLCESDNHPVPSVSDPGFRRIEIGGEDGRMTAAWAVAAGNGKGIVLAHGNSSDRNSMLPRMRYFHSLGYSVIAPDLNAHGETRGTRKTFGFLESKDVGKANRYLRDELGAGWVAALGTSLGGASILKAESDGAEFDAIIIESVFSDIRTAAKNRLDMRLGGFGDILEPFLTAQMPIWLGLSSRSIRPVDWARKCRTPILILAGDSDLRARVWESEAIYAHVPAPLKRLKVFPGAAHVDLFAFDCIAYVREIGGFLADAQVGHSDMQGGPAEKGLGPPPSQDGPAPHAGKSTDRP